MRDREVINPQVEVIDQRRHTFRAYQCLNETENRFVASARSLIAVPARDSRFTVWFPPAARCQFTSFSNSKSKTSFTRAYSTIFAITLPLSSPLQTQPHPRGHRLGSPQS